MSRVMAQGEFRPMAANRAAHGRSHGDPQARRADYARAEAEVDTSGAALEQSFGELVRVVTVFLAGAARAS